MRVIITPKTTLTQEIGGYPYLAEGTESGMIYLMIGLEKGIALTNSASIGFGSVQTRGGFRRLPNGFKIELEQI